MAVSEAKKSQARNIILRAVEQRRIISLKTYYLSEYGEFLLHAIAEEILKSAGRIELLDMVYTAAKELVINATKANLKRAMFHKLGRLPQSPAEYEEAMRHYRTNLVEEKILEFVPLFRELNFPVIATFYYKPEVMHIKVKNRFTLLPFEESRIREKFEKARSFSSLLDFYTEYGDETEGQGLGLTMVGIMLDNSGIDKHLLTLYSNEFNETAARLEVPLNESYTPKRRHFEGELQSMGGEHERERLRHIYASRSFF
ncbi:MAG: hypothetical protein K1X75_02035 [Leptospirales bacterium]|nr:hypothetical protein [Leptospirales bacterium]